MSRLAVHAARRDGEELSSRAMLWKVEANVLRGVSMERSYLSYIGTVGGGEKAAKGDESEQP